MKIRAVKLLFFCLDRILIVELRYKISTVVPRLHILVYTRPGSCSYTRLLCWQSTKPKSIYSTDYGLRLEIDNRLIVDFLYKSTYSRVPFLNDL